MKLILKLRFTTVTITIYFVNEDDSSLSNTGPVAEQLIKVVELSLEWHYL